MLQLRDGFFPHHHLYSGLAQQHKLNCTSRAMLENFQSQVDRRTAITYTSAAALRRELNAKDLQTVKRAQQSCKRAGLLQYPSASNASHVYFLPLKLMHYTNCIRITRRWWQCVEIALENKLIKKPAELIERLVELGHDWPDSEFLDVFSKPVAGAKAEDYLKMGAMPEIVLKKRVAPVSAEKRAEQLKDEAERRAAAMTNLKNLEETIYGRGDENPETEKESEVKA